MFRTSKVHEVLSISVVSLLSIFLLPNPAKGQVGTVLSHQKISDTQGGFTGVLDDADFFGFSLAGIGDLDGDGVNDIAVGALLDDDGCSVNCGAVYIVFLNSDGTVKSEQKISNLEGNFAPVLDKNDFFGYDITGLGDLDGDGVRDIAVGARNDNDGCDFSCGAVYVLFLNTDGTVKAQQKISNLEGTFFGGLLKGDQFGYSITNLGDLDGDSVTDIAVGANMDDTGCLPGSNCGAVYVLFLNTNGTVKSHQKISNNDGGFTGVLDFGDRFGASVAGLGDINGDGVKDLAVGATGDDDFAPESGAVWILFLNADGMVNSQKKFGNPDLAGDFFGGSSVNLGDLDGDGVTDLAVGAPGDDDGGGQRGAVWIFFLNADGTVKSNQKISNTQGGFTGTLNNGVQFGQSVANVGDLDGDGVSELVAGANGDSDGGNLRGAVWILFMEGAPPNAPPTIDVNDAIVTVDEGDTAANTGTVSDVDGDNVAVMATVGSVVGSNNWSWSFDSTDGPAETQTVTITADDGNGGTAQATFELVVNNVAPTVDAVTVPLDPVNINDQPVGASASFSDPAGVSDETYNCSIDYGDGTGLSPSSVIGNTCIGSDHSYANPGVYTVTVTVTDKDSGEGSATAVEFIVIFDPAEGFVTGGGWIDSPAGAFASDVSLTGKAQFGFVSKYKKGATKPSGQTEFQFKAGDLKFHSSSYDWLVIAGAKAMYKGTGTINGEGSFGFQISAIDGQIAGGGDIDKFRIKIKDGDDIVYDNQAGAGDNADPATAIGGGSISVHKSGGKGAGKASESVVEASSETLPGSFDLEQNFPNPFNPTTTISYDVPEVSNVSLIVYDMLGRRVATLVEAVVSAGSHAATFDAHALPSGAYIYRLETPEGTFTKTMLLLK